MLVACTTDCFCTEIKQCQVRFPSVLLQRGQGRHKGLAVPMRRATALVDLPGRLEAFLVAMPGIEMTHEGTNATLGAPRVLGPFVTALPGNDTLDGYHLAAPARNVVVVG